MPVKTHEKLFLGLEEKNFITNGYTIRRFVDVTQVEIRDDKYCEILQIETLSKYAGTPLEVQVR